MTARLSSPAADDADRRLLEALQRNGRASLTELAAAIPLGVSATRARLMALEQRGVITGYRATLDATAFGFALRAVVRMKVHGALYDKVAALLDRVPQIVRCLRVTGESCYVMEVVAVHMDDLALISRGSLPSSPASAPSPPTSCTRS